ncbi:hypothetical protein, partial [Sphingobium indicum]|uniref:hypothetical protein n=1 Tax=Sphingobium indicum TaxID=332055 RepID=UPI00055C32BF
MRLDRTDLQEEDESCEPFIGRMTALSGENIRVREGRLDWNYTPEQLEFQGRVRDFIAANNGPELDTGISYVAG